MRQGGLPGSTGQAALAAGFNALLIEPEADYVKDLRFRLGLSEPPLRPAPEPFPKAA